ncbi:MAG: deoxyribodipyrimidine photo-lyase [Pseudomonadales bacterium]|nr:deoxyribodipyrimidine photo-lyase [Pseudomonadales bacterium]
MSPSLSIFWFRQDLRILDNPALTAAAARGRVLPVYILDEAHPGPWRLGGASRWWLHRSLQALNQALDNQLWIFAGDPLTVIRELISRHGADAVYWNRCYEPWQRDRDRDIKQTLREQDVAVSSYNGSLLWEPWEVLKADGTPYRVFTPFFTKGCLQGPAPRSPESRPPELQLLPCTQSKQRIEELALLPTVDWYRVMATQWQPGETGAAQRLESFLETGLDQYRKGRDYPALEAVSRLSPHLHWGEISPNQVWHRIRQETLSRGLEEQGEHYLRELGWREFSYSLLYHFPELPRRNLQQKFDAFPWRNDAESLRAWSSGMTGYPIVDAGMRELWQTGYMHNRVRMIVASFLVKNLMIHWHQGEEWFWDCLLDADLANNSASWQWVAGCGADAAPYFRIFNPVTQGQKFDPEGHYVRRFIPEIAALPDRHLHDPSAAPEPVLTAAGIELDSTYPRAIVDLKDSRNRALEAFQSLSGKQGFAD